MYDKSVLAKVGQVTLQYCSFKHKSLERFSYVKLFKKHFTKMSRLRMVRFKYLRISMNILFLRNIPTFGIRN